MNKDIIFEEQFIFKKSVVIDVSTFEDETSTNEVIQMDNESPIVKKNKIVLEPQVKQGFYIN